MIFDCGPIFPRERQDHKRKNQLASVDVWLAKIGTVRCQTVTIVMPNLRPQFMDQQVFETVYYGRSEHLFQYVSVVRKEGSQADSLFNTTRHDFSVCSACGGH